MSGPAKEFVPALGFHWLTPAYDLVVRATTRERRFKHALIEQAGIGAGQRVLDLACGTGTLAVWLKQLHPEAEVTGIDADSATLSIAMRKAAAAKLQLRLDCGDSCALPYPDAQFDRVVTSLFFHHLSWREKQLAAREAYRVLKPDGELHVADWGKASNLLMRTAFFAVQMLDGAANTQDNVRGRLVELFERAGFSAVRETRAFSIVLGTLALYRAVKSCTRRSET